MMRLLVTTLLRTTEGRMDLQSLRGIFRTFGGASVERSTAVSGSCEEAKLLKVMRLLVTGLLFCAIFAQAQDVNLSLPSFACNDPGIWCDFRAVNDLSGSYINMTTQPHTRDPTVSTGYVFFRDPVQMLHPNTGQAASFNASFTFEIRGNGLNNDMGDGMAFVMFEDASFRGYPGAALGVYLHNGTQGTKTLCVEYDTYKNGMDWRNKQTDDVYTNDPNDNHIAVDLNSINSTTTALANADRVGIYLKGGYLITSWIDYDSSRSTLDVRIANASQAKPTTALLTYPLNISDVVAVNMTVGISASGGSGGKSGESLYLYSFNFSTFWPPLAPSSSPSPSPSPSSPPPSSSPSPSPLPLSKPKAGSRIALILGPMLGLGFILGLLCLGCCIWYRRLKTSSLDDSYVDHDLLDIPGRFTYKQLSTATNGFSPDSKLGQGGSSSVYRGVIVTTGKEVAVKRVAKDLKEGLKMFLSEVSIVSRLRHRNLVKLIGWCIERGNFLVVYELMPNGSLDKLLFDQDIDDDTKVLPWTRRLAIVKGVAAGLAYLHTGYAQQVVHRDIKSSNVMLDEDFNARLGDFGLSRLVEHSKNPATTQVAGTIGYIAPEAFVEWKSTDKMDVYAFGALVLEVACGRRPIDTSLPPEEIVLVDWVWECNAQGDILKAADPRLAGNFPELEMTNILQMGLLCSHPDPLRRPSIRQVELFLAGDMSLPPVPLNKPVAVYFRSREHGQQKMLVDVSYSASVEHFVSSHELEHLKQIESDGTVDP